MKNTADPDPGSCDPRSRGCDPGSHPFFGPWSLIPYTSLRPCEIGDRNKLTRQKWQYKLSPVISSADQYPCLISNWFTAMYKYNKRRVSLWVDLIVLFYVLREMVSHLSGLPREAPCFPQVRQGVCQVNNSVMIQRIKNLSLVVEPGSKVSYRYGKSSSHAQTHLL